MTLTNGTRIRLKKTIIQETKFGGQIYMAGSYGTITINPPGWMPGIYFRPDRIDPDLAAVSEEDVEILPYKLTSADLKAPPTSQFKVGDRVHISPQITDTRTGKPIVYANTLGTVTELKYEDFPQSMLLEVKFDGIDTPIDTYAKYLRHAPKNEEPQSFVVGEVVALTKPLDMNVGVWMTAVTGTRFTVHSLQEDDPEHVTVMLEEDSDKIYPRLYILHVNTLVKVDSPAIAKFKAGDVVRVKWLVSRYGVAQGAVGEVVQASRDFEGMYKVKFHTGTPVQVESRDLELVPPAYFNARSTAVSAPIENEKTEKTYTEGKVKRSAAYRQGALASATTGECPYPRWDATGQKRNPLYVEWHQGYDDMYDVMSNFMQSIGGAPDAE